MCEKGAGRKKRKDNGTVPIKTAMRSEINSQEI
jgi:hypothetical protein